jgi:hypothetical protein
MEKFSAPQAQRDLEPEKFAEDMSLSRQSRLCRDWREISLSGVSVISA